MLTFRQNVSTCFGKNNLYKMGRNLKILINLHLQFKLWCSMKIG